jgi:cyclase
MSTAKEFTPEATYLEKLTDTVYTLVGGGIASNSGFIIGEYGVMVVDTSMTPAIASHLLAHIKSKTDKPILHLINTHHHGDHTFGNQVFSPVSIASHANCRSDLIASGESFKERQRDMRPYLAEEMDRVEITLPIMTYTDRLVFEYGDKSIEPRARRTSPYSWRYCSVPSPG